VKIRQVSGIDLGESGKGGKEERIKSERDTNEEGNGDDSMAQEG